MWKVGTKGEEYYFPLWNSPQY